jgi:hypothetical protein
MELPAMKLRSSWSKFLFAGLLLGYPCVGASAEGSPEQKVFTDLAGAGHELVLDIDKGDLRMRTPKWADTSGRVYLVDGKRFVVEWDVISDNYKKLSVENRLSVKGGDLYFDGERVVLPAGVHMRNVWQAILWKGWVICIGRTSKTDQLSKDVPPWFASELIAFEATKRISREVRYLTSQPPTRTPRLSVLAPK